MLARQMCDLSDAPQQPAYNQLPVRLLFQSRLFINFRPLYIIALVFPANPKTMLSCCFRLTRRDDITRNRIALRTNRASSARRSKSRRLFAQNQPHCYYNKFSSNIDADMSRIYSRLSNLFRHSQRPGKSNLRKAPTSQDSLCHWFQKQSHTADVLSGPTSLTTP
jgi:hypothetical protein